MALSIGSERTADASAIDSVVTRAFNQQPGVADMVTAIRVTPQYEPELALVAKQAHAVVGFVMISHAELVNNDVRHDVLTLSPLAVDPDHQRYGIGSELVRHVLRLADARTDLPRLVTLEGNPLFYGRLGFEFAPDHGIFFDLPDWAPPAAAQVHCLTGYDSAVRGRLTYPTAFELADD